MADTLRTLAALQTLLADNTTGDISAQDARDFLVSVYPTGKVLLATQTASSSSSLDFTSRNAPFQSGDLFQSDYDEYKILFQGMVPSTNTENFRMQVSTDGGSTWVTSSNSYFGTNEDLSNGTAGAYSQAAGGVGTTSVFLAGGVNNGSNCPGVDGELELTRPLSTLYHLFRFRTCVLGASFVVHTIGGWYCNFTTPYTALRFLFGAGNITSGTIKIYGICK